MATLREILIEWNTASGTGKRSVMYFQAGTAVSAQRTAIFNWLTAIKPRLTAGTQFGVAISGREIEDTDGSLAGAWTEASAKSGNGTGAGQGVADATQVLVRWQTLQIIGRRFLAGRQFIPGLIASDLSGGNLSGTALTVIQGANTALISAGVGLSVWHRPIAGSGGTNRVVVASDTWSELAVLRRRRS